MYRFGSVLLLLLIVACDNGVGTDEFRVRVIDQSGLPIEGASVSGGIDWDSYNVKTNSAGEALLPGSARGGWAMIYKNNYYTRSVSALSDDEYILNETPMELAEVDTISGTAVYFTDETIATIVYPGIYNVYDYNDQGVTQLVSIDLPGPVTHFRAYGNQLWMAIDGDGLYVYNVSGYTELIEICHLEIPGVLGIFCVIDSLIAVCGGSNNNVFQLYSYTYNGNYDLLDDLEGYYFRDMFQVSDYIIGTNDYENMPTVIDISDPHDIEVVYNGVLFGFNQAFHYGDSLITVAGNYYDSQPTRVNLTFDMSEPADPRLAYSFIADGALEGFCDSLWAIGTYYYNLQSVAVFSRVQTITTTVAIISEEGYDTHNGNRPPYFIIGNKLWKLVDR
jgi:hypothetical protein